MKKKIRTLVLVLLGAVFLVSAFMGIKGLLDYQKGAESYAEAAQVAGIPEGIPDPTPAHEGPEEAPQGPQEDPYVTLLRQVDLSALRQVNPDILGWLLIPGTNISYPVARTDNNSFYLDHDWQREPTAVGSIFMDKDSDPSLTGFHTILYGHRMNNRTMFGQLSLFQDQAFRDDHPWVYLRTGDGVFRYEVFAAYETRKDWRTYQIGFKDEGDREGFLTFCMEKSQLTSETPPTPEDRVLTLSTCTNTGRARRWTVQAVLREEG